MLSFPLHFDIHTKQELHRQATRRERWDRDDKKDHQRVHIKIAELSSFLQRSHVDRVRLGQRIGQVHQAFYVALGTVREDCSGETWPQRRDLDTYSYEFFDQCADLIGRWDAAWLVIGWDEYLVNHRPPEFGLGGKVILDGAIAHARFLCDETDRRAVRLIEQVRIA